MTPLKDITELLDRTLGVAEIKDARSALNGLQVENNGEVTRVAVAVDGSQKTIEDAIAAGADLLVLHHGIYWSGLLPLTGWWKKKIVTCLEHNLAIYSAHLPLDMHPTLGNNAGLASGLGLVDLHPEVEYNGTHIGVAGVFPGTVGELKARFEALVGGPVTGVIKDADAPAGKVAVCSGSAGDEIYEMHAKGYDTFVTGEENHWVYSAAQDVGVNILFGGHYGTETFGVRSIGALLEKEFGLPYVFIDNPTGM